jgi:DNA-binding NtrC family response regulator
VSAAAGTLKAVAGLRAIVADDEDDIRLGLARLVGSLGANVVPARDGVEALEAFERGGAELVITDLMMPRLSGAELLLEIKRRSPSTRVVIVTGYGTIQTAVQCLQNGAEHFMTKPFDNAEVLRLVERLGRQALAERQPREESRGTPRLLHEDPAMARVLELVARAAPSPVPVLIEGESGSGKELVARELHALGRSPEAPFLAVNCAALPDTLLESELFGHKRGAFTGADRDYEGLFARAHGGTVFLDEIASMSPQFQGKLLRVLQDKLVRPLGSTRDVPVEFRLVAASNRDLEAMVERAEFREDLFYRLGVVRVRVPPLRERPRDIEPLARHFLARAARTCLPEGAAAPELSEDALAALAAHTWPGNVRELENTMQRAVIVCAGPRILAHHLGLGERVWDGGGATAPLAYDEAKQKAIERFQREFVQRALESSAGNVSRAAEQCGLTRAAFQRIMRDLGIDRDAFTTS